MANNRALTRKHQLSKPTPRQFEVLAVIRAHWQKKHTAPTVAEIAEGAGISKSTAFSFVARLEGHGYITSEPGAHRSISITHRGRQAGAQKSGDAQ